MFKKIILPLVVILILSLGGLGVYLNKVQEYSINDLKKFAITGKLENSKKIAKKRREEKIANKQKKDVENAMEAVKAEEERQNIKQNKKNLLDSKDNNYFKKIEPVETEEKRSFEDNLNVLDYSKATKNNKKNKNTISNNPIENIETFSKNLFEVMYDPVKLTTLEASQFEEATKRMENIENFLEKWEDYKTKLNDSEIKISNQKTKTEKSLEEEISRLKSEISNVNEKAIIASENSKKIKKELRREIDNKTKDMIKKSEESSDNNKTNNIMSELDNRRISLLEENVQNIKKAMISNSYSITKKSKDNEKEEPSCLSVIKHKYTLGNKNFFGCGDKILEFKRGNHSINIEGKKYYYNNIEKELIISNEKNIDKKSSLVIYY